MWSGNFKMTFNATKLRSQKVMWEHCFVRLYPSEHVRSLFHDYDDITHRVVHIRVASQCRDKTFKFAATNVRHTPRSHLLSSSHPRIAEIVTNTKKLNFVVLVRGRTIPTERPPLVGEVSANFCWYRVSRIQRNGSLRPYSRLLNCTHFPDSPLLRKSDSAGNRTRNL
jgi:hypothetical protein